MTSSPFVCEARTLDNGLRVLVAPAPHIHRANVALYARVGSRYETRETNGLSHFLEHMIYRGTPRLSSAHAVNLAFERLGGYLQASTQTDFGVFSVTLPEESLDEASGLFGEVLTRPSFFDIEVEKGIVCEEILEDLDEDGRQVDPDNLSRALIYPEHPLGFTITGDEAQVRGFTRAMLEAHHARHYRAGSSVLVYSGAITPARAFELAARDFGALPAGAAPPLEEPTHAQSKPRLLTLDNQSSQTELRVCFRALGEFAPQRPALDLLMRVIDDGMSTRLYHRICDDQGLCYDVSAGYDGYEDDGVVDFAAGVAHARVGKVVAEILTMIEELATTGPTDEEVEKAKMRHAWDVRALVDSPEDLAGFYGMGALWDRLETPEQRRAGTASVTKEQIRDVAHLLASPARLNVVAVGRLDRDQQRRLTDTVRGWAGA